MKDILKRSEIVIFFILLCIGFVIRFQFSTLNFFQDEVYTAMAVKGILQKGIPEMPSGLIYLRSLPFTYLVSLGSLMFGISEWSIRLVPIILGTVSIGVYYVFIKRISNTFFAIISSLFLVGSPWHIWYSFFARSFLLQALLFLVIIWFYYLFLHSFNKKYLVFNIFFITVSALVSSTSLLLIPTIIFVILLFTRSKHTNDGTLLLLLHIALTLSSFIIPSTIFPWDKSLSANPYSLLQVKSFILPNIYFWKELFSWFPVGFVTLVIAFIYFIKRKNKLVLFPFFIITSFTVLSFFNPFQNLQPRYVSNFMLIYFFVITSFIYVVIKEKKAPYILGIVLFIIASDLYYLPNLVGINYGKSTPKVLQVSQSWDIVHDIKSPVEYVNNNASDSDIIISLQPKGQTEVYITKKLDYLLRTENYLSEGHDSNGIFVDDFSAIPIITSTEEFMTVVNSKRKIWVISSKSEQPELGHINKETYTILSKYGKVVYRGKDPNSKVYVINAN